MAGAEYLLLRNGDLNCPCHINPELEIVYVNKGSVTVWYETEPMKVNEGEATVIFPFSIHCFSVSEDTDATVYMFSSSVAGEFARPHNEFGLYESKFSVSEITKAYIERIIAREKLIPSEIKAVFYAFASECEYYLVNSKTKNENIRRIVEYIYRNMGDEMTLSSVASNLYMSEKNISEIFRKNLKISFSDFLNNIRIEKSKNLLFQGSKNITEIAFECGFDSVRSFNRRFMKFTGKTPSEYKKSIKSINI